MKQRLDMQIEKMKMCHLAEVEKIEQLCFPDAWSMEQFVEEISDNEARTYWITSQKDTVIGYCGMWQILDEAHTMNLAVHPDYRRLGVADALLQTMIALANQNKLSAMTLEVRGSNVPALRLYKKYGFLEAGVRRNYYANPTDHAVIMWKTMAE